MCILYIMTITELFLASFAEWLFFLSGLRYSEIKINNYRRFETADSRNAQGPISISGIRKTLTTKPADLGKEMTENGLCIQCGIQCVQNKLRLTQSHWDKTSWHFKKTFCFVK